MPPKNPYENIKITLKEDESRFLLNLLDESKFTRRELDIVDKIYGKLINSTRKREMRIEQHEMELQKKASKGTLDPTSIGPLINPRYYTPETQELTRMESMTRALIKHTLSGDDATGEENES